MSKKIKYLCDCYRNDVYVKAWKEGREIIVQIWLKGNPEGEPDGDWAMPSVLGVDTCIAQAILQTKK